jgi:hypothetical protein
VADAKLRLPTELGENSNIAILNLQPIPYQYLN